MSTDAPILNTKVSLRAIRADLLSRPDFMKIQTIDFIRKLLEQAAIILVGAWLIFYFENVIATGIGFFLIGAAYARNLELVHECIHYIAFQGRFPNRFWGGILALPMLTSFEEWQYLHLRHHADVRNEGFEFSVEKISSICEIVSHFLMLDYYKTVFKKMMQSVYGGVEAPPEIRKGVNMDYRIMLAAVILAIITSFVFKTWFFALIWLFPLIFASFINFHVQLPEHYHCDTAAKDAMRNSRTIEAGWFAAWYVNNNNLHTSHHWIPTAPIRTLPEIDLAVRPYIQAAGESYPSFYWGFYKQLWENFRRKAIE